MEISDIIPTRVDERIDAVKGYVGKVTRTFALKDKFGNILMESAFLNIIIYIRNAVNNYYRTAEYQKQNAPTEVSNLLYVFTLPGRPMQKSEKKKVTQTESGNLLLCENKAYTERVRYLNTQLNKIINKKCGPIPIKCRVNAECVFYVKTETSKDRYSLMYYIVTCIETLYKLKLISSIGANVIASTDKSRIVFVKKEDEQKTVVFIRKLPEEREE